MLAVIAVAAMTAGLAAPRLDADGFPLPAGALARFGSTRFAPGAGIYYLMYSQDGRHLAAYTDAGVYVWDAATGRLEFRTGDGQDLCQVLGFCPSGELVVARFGPEPRPRLRWRFDDPKWPLRLEREEPGSGGPTPVFVQRFDLATGRMRSSVRLPTSHPMGLVLSPDGAWVAYLLEDQSGIAVSHTLTGRERWRQTGQGFDLGRGVFTADGRRLYWECRDRETAWVARFDARTGKPAGFIPTNHEDHARNWLLSPDGKWLVTDTRGFEVWDTATPAMAFRLGLGESLLGFPEPDRLAITSEKGVELWNLKARKRVGVLKDWSPDGMAVSPVTGSVALYGDFRIDIFDPRTGRRVAGTLDKYKLPEFDGFTNRGGVRLRWTDPIDPDRYTEWNPRTGRTTDLPPRHSPPPEVFRSGGESPDHSTYATVSGKVLTVFDARTRRPVRELVGDSDLSNPLLHPSGRVFAVGDEVAFREPRVGQPKNWRPLYVWGADGRRRAVIPLPEGTFHSVQPDGAAVVTWRQIRPVGSGVTEIVRWDADTGKRIAAVRVTGIESDPAFTPDGRWFLARYGGTFSILWKGPTGKFLGLFDGTTGRWVRRIPMDNDAFLSPYRISPDGRTVAVGRRDGVLAVIELATGKARTGFRHDGLIDAVEFSPDGLLLVGINYLNQILVWHARAGAAGFPTTPPDAAALAAAWDDLAAEDAREAFVAVRLLAAFPDRAIPFLKQKPAPDGLRAVRAVEAVEWIGTPDAVKLLDRWAGGSADSTLAVEAKAARARLARR